MKKLVTLLLTVVLSLSLATGFIACGNVNNVGDGSGKVFESKYTQTTPTELKTFAKEVEKVDDAEEFDFSKGLALNYEMKINMGDGEEALEITSKMDIKTALKDGELKLSAIATTSSNTNAENNPTADMVVSALGGLDMEMYFNNNNYYAKVGDAKYYVPFTANKVDDAVEDNFDGALDVVYEIDDIIEILDKQTDAKVYVDKVGDYTKFKIEAKAGGSLNTISQEGSLVIVLVFDKDYRLIAYKMEMTYSGKVMGIAEGTTTITLSIEPYSGKIVLPNDLDTYINVGDSLDDLMDEITKNSILK